MTYFTGRAERLMHKILRDSQMFTGEEEVIAVLNPGRRGHSKL